MTHTAATQTKPLARRALSALTATALLAGLLVGTPSAARASGTIYVGPGSDGSGLSCAHPDYGATTTDARSAIALAIDDASDPDVVYICAGTYELNETVHIDRAVTIQGAGAGSVILTPDGFDGTLLMVQVDATISDITVDGASKNGGVGDGNGAAILAWSGTTLTVNDSVFTNNEAVDGAAIWIDSDSSLITHDNLFQGNVAEDGGAIWFNAGTEGSLSGDTFIDNHAESECGVECSPEGGAIYMSGSYPSGCLLSVEDVTFSGNTSDEDGGAIFANDVDLATITNSTFTDNHAIGESSTTEGGAVYFQSSGSLTVVGSRFTGNSAYEDGGAIDLDSELSGDLTVLNSTFVNNHASGDLDADGGAIEGQGYTMTVSGSTFKGNVVTGLGGGGAISASTATITGSSFTRNTSQTHGGAVALSAPASSDLRLIRRNTFSRNEAQVAGGAITLGPCGATTRSEERLLFGANRFLGNRATEQRRTMNIERWEQCAP